MSATIGHNQPKPMTPEEVEAYLLETCADLTKRQGEILAGIERFKTAYPTIPDADVQGKAADFAGSKGAIAAFTRLAESRRVAEKQPFDRAGAAVQGFFKKLAEPIEAGQREIRARMTQFAERLERERRAKAQAEAEAAAKLAREAEAKALASMSSAALDDAAEQAKAAERAAVHADAKPAEHSRVTGSLGGTVSLRTTYRLNEAESDLLALACAVVEGRAPLKYLAFHSVNIGIAIRSEGVRAIPGCQIDEVRSV